MADRRWLSWPLKLLFFLPEALEIHVICRCCIEIDIWDKLEIVGCKQARPSLVTFLQVPSINGAHLRAGVKGICEWDGKREGAGGVFYGHFECALEGGCPARVAWINPTAVPAQLESVTNCISCSISNMRRVRLKTTYSFGMFCCQNFQVINPHVAVAWYQSGLEQTKCDCQHQRPLWPHNFSLTD